MAAFEIPNLRFSFEAMVDIPRYRFVTVNPEGKAMIAGPMDKIIGVSMQPAKAGEPVEVADGIVMVEAGDMLNGGWEIMADSEGKAVSGPSEEPDTPSYIAGIALTRTAAAGELVTVKINPYFYPPAPPAP